MRRALVVGIDDYAHAATLHGCVNDAEAVSQLLAVNHDGSPNFSVRTLTSTAEQHISRTDLLRAIDELFKQEADMALLYFSGHGTENDLGGYLVTSDASAYAEGVAMSDLMTKANKSKVKQAVVMLDSCHSGALGQVPAIASNDTAMLREGISILTASRATESALETGGSGLFTALVCAALEGGAADVLGDVNAAGIYSYVDESLGPWEQRPLFKTHVSRLLPIRRASPPIPVEVVRRLPEWFPTAGAEFALDPGFEPTEEPRDSEKEAVFDCLQKCARARLVQPVGEEHMYYAAMNGKACQLTALGRHYWLRGKKGQL